jgi:exopolysaccharide production protein ExoZ
MNEERAPLRRLYGLQYLRALAALCVLAFHAMGSQQRLPWALLQLGVDLFFVLSGFLMVAITDESTRPLPFFRDRFLRVVPLYWLATAMMVLALWSGLAWSLRTTPWHVFASFAFIPAVNPSLDGDARMFPILAPGWTLNSEMMFYALFAAMLALPRRWQAPALTAALVGIAALGLLLRPATPALRGWTHPIALEFVAGAWLGLAWQQGRRLWPVLALSVVAAVPCWLFMTVDPAWRRLLILPVLVGLLVAVLILERRPGGIPEWRIPRLIGDASYSIYLCQVFAMMAWSALQTRNGLPRSIEPIAIFVTGTIGGIAVWRLVERPLLALFSRRRRYRRGAPVPGGI